MNTDEDLPFIIPTCYMWGSFRKLYKKKHYRKKKCFIHKKEWKIHCPCRTLPENTVTDNFPTVILQQLKNVSSTSLRSILTRQAVPSCKYHCLIWRVWSGAQTQAQEMAGFDSIRRQSFYLLQLSSPYNHLNFTQRTCIHTRMAELKWDQVSPSLLLRSDRESWNHWESLSMHLSWKYNLWWTNTIRRQLKLQDTVWFSV